MGWILLFFCCSSHCLVNMLKFIWTLGLWSQRAIKVRAGHVQVLGSLSNRQRRRQSRQAVKIFRHNPCVFLGIYLLWLPCLFLFLLNFNCFQRLFLNEKIDDNSWNIDLILEQDSTNVSFISRIHVCFSSCVISLLLFCRRCCRRPWLFCLNSLLFTSNPEAHVVLKKHWKIFSSMLFWYSWSEVCSHVGHNHVSSHLVEAEFHIHLLQQGHAGTTVHCFDWQLFSVIFRPSPECQQWAWVSPPAL